jgi:outer membrane protein
MKYFSFFLFFFFIINLAQAKSYQLDDLFDHALKNFENIQIQDQEIKVKKSEHRQIIGALLPKAYLESEIEYQSERRGFGGFDNSIDATQDQTNFSFTQPIFHGGREYIALSQTKQRIKQEKDRLQLIRNQIYLEIANAFYEAISLTKERKILDQIDTLLNDQIKELDERSKIGKVRTSESTLAYAKKTEFLAEKILVDAKLKNSFERIHFLTKLPLNINLKDNSNIDEIKLSLNQIEERPEYQIANKDLKIASQEKTKAYLYFLPDIDVYADYLALKPEGFRSSEWIVTGELSLPLFEGSVRFHQIAENKAKLVQEKLRVNRLKRELNFEAQSKYNLVKAYYLQNLQLSKATDLAQKSYQEELENLKRNLVTELDTLNVLDNYLQVKRKTITAEKNLKLSFIDYKIASGENQ